MFLQKIVINSIFSGSCADPQDDEQELMQQCLERAVRGNPESRDWMAALITLTRHDASRAIY